MFRRAGAGAKGATQKGSPLRVLRFRSKDGDREVDVETDISFPPPPPPSQFPPPLPSSVNEAPPFHLPRKEKEGAGFLPGLPFSLPPVFVREPFFGMRVRPPLRLLHPRKKHHPIPTSSFPFLGLRVV